VLPARGNVDPYVLGMVRQRMMATIQSAQPGVPLLDIPAVNAGALSASQIKDIGAEHSVGAVLLVEVQVGPVRQSTNVNPFAASVNQRQDVSAEMIATLRETTAGAIVWTNGAEGSWNLQNTNVGPGRVSHSQSDLEARYSDMVSDLIRATTRDLRPTYEIREVPNE